MKYCSRSILNNLTLVSHHFYTLAIPYVFRTLEIPDTRCGVKFGLFSFCAALAEGNERAAFLASHVKAFRVGIGKTHLEVGDYHPPSSAEYIQATPSMPNLQELFIGNVQVDKQSLQTMCGLQHLTLSFLDVRFDDNITDAFLLQLPLVSPKELFCWCPSDSERHSKIITSVLGLSNLESFFSCRWGNFMDHRSL